MAEYIGSTIGGPTAAYKLVQYDAQGLIADPAGSASFGSLKLQSLLVGDGSGPGRVRAIEADPNAFGNQIIAGNSGGKFLTVGVMGPTSAAYGPIKPNVAYLYAIGDIAIFPDSGGRLKTLGQDVSGSLTVSETVRPGAYTVATLPTPGTSGRLAYASNARVGGQAAGAGTGALVSDNGSTWQIVGTNVTAAA